MSGFQGKTFVLELNRDVRFKAKQDLINYLREQQANISYILTASTDYVLVSNDVDTYKTRRARQLGISLLNVEYIQQYRQLSPAARESLDIKRFIVTSAEEKENFAKSGTIPVSGGGSSVPGGNKPVKIDVSKIKIWNSDDVELPKFDELTHAQIGKWAIFQESNPNSDVYFALELQIIPEEYYNRTIDDYRLRFRYEKQTITHSKGKMSVIQYAFSQDINELHQLFASYYHRIATMPRITRIRDLLPDKFASKLLLRSLFLHRIDTQILDDNVCQLIESIWIESIGDLNKILTVRPESIALKTIIEAEAALLEIKSDSKSASEAETRFYSLIPHQPAFIVNLINNRRALIDKTDLCQMLRDMLTVNELTNWNVKASIEAKYRALKCHIETLDYDSQEYSTINEMIRSSTNANEQVIVHQIYSIAKQTDALNFRSTLFNQRQLFHGSKYNNFLGILSRGLLMPKMVVNDLGVTRTDIGCLGYGIYFSDSVSTSLKYTTSSTTRPGRRLLCISQVALGESANYYSYVPNLTQPPENFHSTHGIKRTNENNSKFVDDEYAVYNLDQQRLLYIVEVSWSPFDDQNQILKSLPIIRDPGIHQSKSVDIPSTIEDEVIEIAEQDYGLICPSSGQLVPLKAFHIRSQLVDVTAEVTLYQVYHNTSAVPIEAKYVFPLDENCSVCGFEAHINNKIIKGVVKEKEQAKREYREAIEKGHGAYLMHQEQAEVFSVSVGNLPANCEVIIKITYVAELPIENNDIIFRLPAKVASWQSKQALDSKDQSLLPSINLDSDNSKSVEFSLKTSIRMPYEILKLFSPTHRLRRKITDCIAMIELVDNILLEKDFILSITLKSVNLPRMLNETFEEFNEDSQACMLTFYPRFEMMNTAKEFVEVVFIIDVSNSMDGKHVQQAKQVAHLFLTNMRQNDGMIYFNIVTFGSDNDECFPISSPNTKENLDKAKHFILHSLDHRGNTDLFSVLRSYSLIPSISKLGRQFLLLSDGHINDLSSISTLLTKQSSMRHDRFFTCSIGDTSNKHNLKQLANQATGGGLNTVFDSNYRSRWKSKILQILEHIHQPCVTNISIDWHGTVDTQQEKFTNQAPNIIRSLFNGMRLTVYRFIRNCHKATLTAMIDNQEFVTSVFSNKITESKGRILHCLTARAIIQDYENGLLHEDESENELLKKQYKQDLIELSIKHSVVSSFTSFVAIEERDGEAIQPGVRVLDVMLEKDVDLLPYIGWEGDRSQQDLIKEKLLNAKRLFDSASITSKGQLTNEYEELCKNISYRSGGKEKHNLMLTIIDTYETVLKEQDKARMLKEKMVIDLMNEMKNATADERQTLEKQLDEVHTRFDRQESSEHLNLEGLVFGEDYDDIVCLNDRIFDEFDMMEEQCMEEAEETSTSESSDASIRGKKTRDLYLRDSSSSTESEDEDDCRLNIRLANYSLKTAALKLAPCEASKREQEKSWGDDDGDMGFDLFDDEDEEKESSLSIPLMSINKDRHIMLESKNLPEEASSLSVIAPTVTLESDEDLFGEVAIVKTLSPPNVCAVKPVEDMPSLRKLKKRHKEPPKKLESAEEDFDAFTDQLQEFSALVQKHEVLLKSFELASDSNLNSRDELSPVSTSSSMPKQDEKLLSEPSLSEHFLDDGFSFPLKLMAKRTQPASVKAASVSRAPSLPAAQNKPSSSFSFGIPPPPTQPLLLPPMPMPHPVTLPKSMSRSGFLPVQTSSSFLPPPPPPPPPPPLLPLPMPPPPPVMPGFGGPPPPPVLTSSSFLPAPPPPPPPLPSAMPGSFLFGAKQNKVGADRPVSQKQPEQEANQPAGLFTGSVFGTAAGFGSTSWLPQQQQQQQPQFSFGTASASATTTTSTGPLHPLSVAAPAFVPAPPLIQNNLYHPFFQPDPQISSHTASTGSMFGGFHPSAALPAAAYTPQLPPQDQQQSSSYYQPPHPPQTNNGFFGSSNNNNNNSYTFGMPSQAAPTSFSFGSAPQPFQQQQGFSLDTSSINADSQYQQQSTDSYLSDCFSQSVFHPATLDSIAQSTESITATSNERDDRAGDVTVESKETSRGGRGRSGFFATINPRRRMAKTSTIQDESYDRSVSLKELEAQENRQTDFRFQVASLRSTSVKSSNEEKHKGKFSAGRGMAVPSGGEGRMQDLLLLDVIPLSLGIEDIHGHMCIIAERNRTIPFKTQRYTVFTNAYAYQTSAVIRVFSGEHKLTKYNTFMGEFSLTGLTNNFASQVLEISIIIDLDANGIIQVQAEESRSGAQAKITINPQDHRTTLNEIQRHMDFVESDPDFRAIPAANRSVNDPLFLLNGETEHSKIHFTDPRGLTDDLPRIETHQKFDLTSTMINKFKSIQLPDGSFDLNDDLANLFSINITVFETLKKYLIKQGFNSFALNIQNEILRLIATGIVLMKLFFQIPVDQRGTYLVPFDHQSIRSIFQQHLPRILSDNLDRTIHFYEQKRQRYDIYCDQLELKYSTWDKFLQFILFQLND